MPRDQLVLLGDIFADAPVISAGSIRLRSVRSTSCTMTSVSSPLSSATAKAAPPLATQCGMRGLDGVLDILRIVIDAADDDDVLDPAGDV